MSVYFKGFLRTHELDWAIERGQENPYVGEEGPWETVTGYSWRDEIHSCCNPDCLHPSHAEPRQKLCTARVAGEAAQAADEKIWGAKRKLSRGKATASPFTFIPRSWNRPSMRRV